MSTAEIKEAEFGVLVNGKDTKMIEDAVKAAVKEMHMTTDECVPEPMNVVMEEFCGAPANVPESSDFDVVSPDSWMTEAE